MFLPCRVRWMLLTFSCASARPSEIDAEERQSLLLRLELCGCTAKARRAATLRAWYRKTRLPRCAEMLGDIDCECTKDFQTAALESVAANCSHSTQNKHHILQFVTACGGAGEGHCRDQINFLDSAPVRSQRHATLDQTFWSKLQTRILGAEVVHLTVCAADRCRKLLM